MIYPVFWLIVGSFQTESGDWTLAHYREVFSPYYLKLLWNSLVYALLSTAVAMLIGVPMALAVARTDMPGKSFFRAASAVTFVLPPLFQAMAFVVIFQPNAGLMNVLFQELFGVKPFNIFSFTGLVLVTAAAPSHSPSCWWTAPCGRWTRLWRRRRRRPGPRAGA